MFLAFSGIFLTRPWIWSSGRTFGFYTKTLLGASGKRLERVTRTVYRKPSINREKVSLYKFEGTEPWFVWAG